VTRRQPVVLVVHCVDTEGPLGGDARRLPDGSPEFMDDWDDILESLRELTAAEFRSAGADSFGGPYRFNWFVMDFTGFRTNPKCRVAAYHNTWDNITSLPVELDGLYWHYHVPPENGAGDEWSDTWLSSNECNVILARRLLERRAFPAAFRAGGTIEDEAASRWLEEVVPIDFSNRVSERSSPDADLYRFSWYGAPANWGSYHPALGDPMREGGLGRFVYRSIDLRSRYNELTQEHVDACFAEVAATGEARVLSYFSHDNRDMRPETYHVVELLRRAEGRLGVRWASCTAVEAHRRYHGLAGGRIELTLAWVDGGFAIRTSAPPFQRVPFTAGRLADGRVVRLYPKPVGAREWRLALPGGAVEELGVAVTAPSGETAVAHLDGAGPRNVPG
jgi:hypothetical protein